MTAAGKTAAHADAVAVQKSVAAQVIAATFPTTVARKSTDEWLDGASFATGHDLEKRKGNLVSVPFKITGVVFRDGITDKVRKSPTNYASVEIEIAPQELYDKMCARRGVSSFMWDAGDALVFNDGSTGVCRQLVQFLAGAGYITVPAGPEDGGAGESRYDSYRAKWLVNGAQPSAEEDLRIDIRGGLVCLRGLRVSEYDNDGREVETYYLG